MEKVKFYQDITIAIVLYEEDFDLLYKTLDKLRSFKKIIIDNANNFDLKKKIQSIFSIENYILNKKNSGFSAGYNQAAKLCKTKYLLILGPDCIISETNILKLTDNLSKDPSCFLVSPTAYDESMNKMTYSGGPFPENLNRDIVLNLSGNTCVESTLGACMLVRTNEFKYIGLFDENFFIYFSDDDLCRRIRKHKKSVIQIYDSKCTHIHGIVKIKNKYLKKFVRENNYTFDSLYYYYKIHPNHTEVKKILKKTSSLTIKFFIKILSLNFIEFVGISARLFAISRFIYRFKLKKSKF